MRCGKNDARSEGIVFQIQDSKLQKRISSGGFGSGIWNLNLKLES